MHLFYATEAYPSYNTAAEFRRAYDFYYVLRKRVPEAPTVIGFFFIKKKAALITYFFSAVLWVVDLWVSLCAATWRLALPFLLE